ncbi:DUF4365 domain-containing protein [Flavobacterium granuli]|uniref:DUF4365 domain-containing protein n=1 Tax=Flavobacterium granuli TaxID=280093 RepID=A0ABU1S4J0_9FLAO|nr:DUF4365 domain-containing protein [Flavobacterium granuli]MDR6845935.1 hypothetical protein [Flavobacterium granuli]
MTSKNQTKVSKNHIEKEANAKIRSKLRNLFLLKDLELLENETNSSQDWGTDIYMEVLNKAKDHRREMLFLIQSKGMNKKPKPLKDENSFSFQMSLRHANYFYHQLSEPLIFMVCDITTEIIYWYAVQIDIELNGKIIEQAKKGKKTLQVKIPLNNILNEGNFERFFSDLENSQRNQLHKRRTKLILKANYNQINENISELNIVEGLCKVIDSFEGINVLPISVINELNIFKGSSGYLLGETLLTDNEVFYDFVSNLEIREGICNLKNKSVNYFDVDDLQNKLEKILNFFSVNWITHVTWRGKSVKAEMRICVHNLYISNECNCERCSYSKLNFKKTRELLKSQIDSKNIEFRLRKAYTYYLIADLEKSYIEYKEIIAEINISKFPGFHIIAKFNLLQLKKMISWDYFGDNRNEILKDLEDFTFDLDEILVPEYFLDIFKLIKEKKFIDGALWDIDSKLSEIQKLWYSDQFGGSSRNSQARNLIVGFLRTYNFIEYNLLIYNEYRDFEVLVNKSLEGIFALYSINNPASNKYDHFGFTIIDMWLFHAEPKHIKHLLRKYGLKSLDIQYSDITYDRLHDYIDNLMNSAQIIIENYKNENYKHNNKIIQITSNYLTIIGIINISNDQKNLLLGKYLALLEILGESHFGNYDFLYDYLNNSNEVSIFNLKKIISLLVLDDLRYSHVFTLAIEQYLEKLEGAQVKENALKEILQINEFRADDFCNREQFLDLIFVINDLTAETKNLLKKQLKSKLDETFNEQLYYLFSIHSVLDYEKELFEKYLKLTPDYTKKQTGHEFLSGRKELKNYHLDKVINLMFKFDLEFTPEIRSLSSKAFDKDYYDWLMNIEGFDYSKFNLYWILYFNTDFYRKAFGKSDKLKLEIIKALKENYIEGVAKIFLRTYN